jgi:uncharacterized protein (DUF58 family)
VIYPTRAGVLAAAAGVPVALAVAALAPGRWATGLAWSLAVVLATVVDALLAPAPGRARLALALPPSAPVGGPVEVRAEVAFDGAGPRAAELALGRDPLLAMDDDGRAWLPLDGGRVAARIATEARRRGTARIAEAWLRWKGPLGLAWRQRRFATAAETRILPDIRPVRERGARIFQRHALQGLVAQLERGDGTDFEALVEYRAGMDRRAIDWKQSARHLKLHAKEFRVERNNQIVFAIDAGRQMVEPVAGLPRVDRAVSAALLAGWVALKLGDRVAIHAFDAAPRLASGFVSGRGAFAELQRVAAGIDYAAAETNYTYALTTIGQHLTRRSMIVLFTEFPDLTAAGFLVRAAARLAETHLLLVVVLRDAELEEIVDAPPAEPGDVTRAITAAQLLRDRLEVLTRLRHLGAHVVEAPHDQVGDRLVDAYVQLKKRNLL